MELAAAVRTIVDWVDKLHWEIDYPPGWVEAVTRITSKAGESRFSGARNTAVAGSRGNCSNAARKTSAPAVPAFPTAGDQPCGCRSEGNA